MNSPLSNWMQDRELGFKNFCPVEKKFHAYPDEPWKLAFSMLVSIPLHVLTINPGAVGAHLCVRPKAGRHEVCPYLLGWSCPRDKEFGLVVPKRIGMQSLGEFSMRGRVRNRTKKFLMLVAQRNFRRNVVEIEFGVQFYSFFLCAILLKKNFYKWK